MSGNSLRSTSNSPKSASFFVDGTSLFEEKRESSKTMISMIVPVLNPSQEETTI